MDHSPFIFDATADNFQRLVLENSENGPVFVNYWSPRVGPCMRLMPRLIRLTTEFEGRFLVVMLNTDELHPLARTYGVNSLPTVKVFRNGKVVDTLHGAETENVLRGFVSRHVDDRRSTLHQAALEAHQQGNTEKAVSLAAQAALADPDNMTILPDLAKLMILEERYGDAMNLLNSLPAEVRVNEDIRYLIVHLSFINAARNAPSLETLQAQILEQPHNLDARFQLSAVKVLNDDYSGAMDQLLEIVRHEAEYQDHIARNGLSAIFKLLGNDDERVHRYRALLQETLH